MPMKGLSSWMRESLDLHGFNSSHVPGEMYPLVYDVPDSAPIRSCKLHGQGAMGDSFTREWKSANRCHHPSVGKESQLYRPDCSGTGLPSMPAPSASPTATAVPVNVVKCGQAVNVFISQSATSPVPIHKVRTKGEVCWTSGLDRRWHLPSVGILC